MKLIPVILIITIVKAQKFPQDFPFPPQYPSPGPGYPSDGSLYLPPESPTPIPYFPMKNVNKLPVQYLPPTGTKAPSMYPSPFPMMMSSTYGSKFDENDEKEENNIRNHNKSYGPSQPPQTYHQEKSNQTNHGKNQDKRENKSMPKTVNYENQVDRVDIKFQRPVPSMGMHPQNQNQGFKTIVFTPETHRNDHILADHVKAASILGHQVFPGTYLQPTTEPAIPILRLSNEMDLDGSFSYEALGADQTHYMQQSHMENVGSENEQQVVEGSYSYVGDNGQTYTVHYIADANGFRASGDHLPVPPPVPEIIQRAVQYNLQEEAKKPPHLKSWQEEEKEHFDEKGHRFVAPPPPRNLFTGKVPEAFSYSYGSNQPTQVSSSAQQQHAHQQQQYQQQQHQHQQQQQQHQQQNNNNLVSTSNNLVPSASSHVPVKTVDFSQEPKPNGPAISPQITFLATQGAHVPSLSAAQQTIARIFNTDKPNMPQLMNYEADLKDPIAEESKVGLWRWQYGMGNQQEAPNKNSISRSYGENDDIMINFSDMTPEQYSNMIQQTQSKKDNDQSDNANYPKEDQNIYNIQDIYKNDENVRNASTEKQSLTVNEGTPQFPLRPDWYSQNNKQSNNYAQSTTEKNHVAESRELSAANKDNIITHHKFLPPSQTITKSYDYEDTFYEPRRTKALTKKDDTSSSIKPNINDYFSNTTPNTITSSIALSHNIITTSPNYFTENTSPSHNYASTNLNTIWKSPNYYSENTSQLPNYGSTSVITAWKNSEEYNSEFKSSTTTTENPFKDIKNLKFSDFIVKEDSSDFKPIIKITTTEKPQDETTTTEVSVEDMFNKNFFLKNFVRGNKLENKNNNNIFEEIKENNKLNVEPLKFDKTPKLIQYHTKNNAISPMKNKVIDLSDVLNYVSSKNNFESVKMKSKSNKNLSPDTNQKFIPIIQNFKEEKQDYQEQKAQNNNDFRNFSQQQQEELRGIIKNYKVLQRNNNLVNPVQNNPGKVDLTYAPSRFLHAPNLPPLGRAGPSMKSYLPPIFV